MLFARALFYRHSWRVKNGRVGDQTCVVVVESIYLSSTSHKCRVVGKCSFSGDKARTISSIIRCTPRIRRLARNNIHIDSPTDSRHQLLYIDTEWGMKYRANIWWTMPNDKSNPCKIRGRSVNVCFQFFFFSFAFWHFWFISVGTCLYPQWTKTCHCTKNIIDLKVQ